MDDSLVKRLKEAIEQKGGQAAFAELLSPGPDGKRLRQSNISNWLNRDKRVPYDRVLEVEELTGVPHTDLRPDIYPFPLDRASA